MSTLNIAAKAQAFKALNIKENSKLILCLDGGGIRGILTVQLLKQIEQLAGIPCYQLFDMVAGTSTGGILAGLIASGKTAIEIENLYIQLVTKVFKKRGFPAGRFIDSPEYDKVNYRADVESIVGDTTLAAACKANNIDLMITSKDVTGNEETFFTCFNLGNTQKGTYKDCYLRYVMEATMSAPTYFRPFERFLDGGTTAYNNPSLAALMEAKCYDGKDKYASDVPLTLFSLGTGTTVQSVQAADAADPKGLAATFWLNYVMAEASQDASVTQIDTLRSGLIGNIDYRRFQISLDTDAVKQLPDKDISTIHSVQANKLSQLTDKDLNGIALDDVDKFDLMKVIGQAMVDKIMQSNKFTTDFIDPKAKRDVLVTAFGDVQDIQSQLSSKQWINSVPTE